MPYFDIQSYQNGPNAQKSALLGQFPKSKIMILVSIGSKIGGYSWNGEFILFHFCFQGGMKHPVCTNLKHWKTR